MKNKEIKFGALLSYIIIFVNTILGLLITPYILNSLGQNMYGLYLLIGSLASYMYLMDFGISTTIIRYLSRYITEKNEKAITKFLSTVTIMYSVIGFIIFIIGLVIYFNLENILKAVKPEDLSTAKTMFLITMINVSITLLMKALPALINAYEKFIFSKILDLSRILIRSIAIYIMMQFDYGAISIVIIDTLLNLLLMLIRSIYIIKNFKLSIKFEKLDYSFIREILSFSTLVFLSSIINLVNTKVDQTILGIVSTTEQVAITGIALMLVEYYHQFSYTLSGLFFPKINSLLTKYNVDYLESFLIKVSKIQSKLLILLLIGFAFVGKQFIELWAGKNYDDAYIIVLILMLSNLIPFTQGVLLSVTQALNKHGFRNWIYFFITIINILLTIPLAKNYGAIGAASSTALTSGIGYFIFIQTYYHKKIGINMKKYLYETFIKVMPSSVSTILFSFIIFKFIHFVNENIILKIMTILSLYAAFTFLLEMKKKERVRFKENIYRLLNSR